MLRTCIMALALGMVTSMVRAGTLGKDFFYFYQNNTDQEEKVGAVSLRYWFKASLGTADIFAFGPPNIMSVELPAGSTFPVNGEGFHLKEDAYYVVIRGEALVDSLGDGSPLKSGDWAWAMAGVKVGPIRNVAAGVSATVYVFSSGKFEIMQQEDVKFDNPTINSNVSRTRFCRYNGGALGCDYSGPHTADRVSWSAGGYKPCASLPGHPLGSCLQPHYHPNGALYIGLSGRTFYAQDYADFDAWIDSGDVRWVRPGQWYGPEYTNDGCEILAMHPCHGGSGDTHGDTSGSWVSFNKYPKGPYVVQYTSTVSKVYGEEAAQVDAVGRLQQFRI